MGRGGDAAQSVGRAPMGRAVVSGAEGGDLNVFSNTSTLTVIPAKAGIQLYDNVFGCKQLDPCLRKDDGIKTEIEFKLFFHCLPRDQFAPRPSDRKSVV